MCAFALSEQWCLKAPHCDVLSIWLSEWQDMWVDEMDDLKDATTEQRAAWTTTLRRIGDGITHMSDERWKAWMSTREYSVDRNICMELWIETMSDAVLWETYGAQALAQCMRLAGSERVVGDVSWLAVPLVRALRDGQAIEDTRYTDVVDACRVREDVEPMMMVARALDDGESSLSIMIADDALGILMDEPDMESLRKPEHSEKAIARTEDIINVAEELADMCDERGEHEAAEATRSVVQEARTQKELLEEMQERRGQITMLENRIREFEDAWYKEQPAMKYLAWLRALDIDYAHPVLEVTTQFKGDGSAPVVVLKEKIGRNDPCACGSGKKFKKCCGVNV
jgi:uncharacterized protein YchJ